MLSLEPWTHCFSLAAIVVIDQNANKYASTVFDYAQLTSICLNFLWLSLCCIPDYCVFHIIDLEWISMEECVRYSLNWLEQRRFTP